MRSLLLSTLLGLVLILNAFAGGTITWPATTTPDGANSAVIPVPRLEWFNHFQKNLDAAKRTPKIDLIFDGDSITDFWMTTGAETWKARYGDLHAFDFGIAGDQTQHLLWRLQNGQVDELHPKLIVLLIGTNNAFNTPEQTAEGIKAIIAEYQKRCPEAAILLQGIFPRSAHPTDSIRAKIKSINRIIASFADGKKILYLDFGDKFLQPDGTLNMEIMRDYLHPTAKGYEIWADAIQPVIDRFFPPAAAPVAPTPPTAR
jgi:lysophospholipase L1-like esterase